MYSKVEETAEGLFEPVLKIKMKGRVDLGTYSTARKAAVAHDVARLVFLHEMRPGTDLRLDTGLMHPPDAYLVDPTFKQLLDSREPFDSVCQLLKSGALVDNFICARDRQTRSTTSGDRPAASHKRQQHSGSGTGPAAPAEPRLGGHAAGEPPAGTRQEAAPTKQQQQSHKSSAETHHALPPFSPFESHPSGGATPGGGGGDSHPPAALAARSGSTAVPPEAAVQAAEAGGDTAGSPSAASKKKPMRWVEWPMRGGGQFVSCISERALKSNMTLPVKMKRELFQVADSPAPIDVYDLQPGSTQRWKWEVRDYVKEERRVTSIHHLSPFFKHYGAQPGDVMVVVASAPGAVKATVWKCDSQEAAEFNAFQDSQAEKAAEKQGRQGVAAASRKRAADAPGDRAVAAAKASKTASAQPAEGPAPGAGAGAAAPSASPDASRPLSKSGSGPLRLQHSSAQHLPPHPASTSKPPAQQRHAGAAAKRPALPQAHGAAAVAGPARVPPQLSPPPARLQGHEALVALAESGVDPSPPSAEETQALSPTAQVAQSPYRHQPLLPPLSSMAIKQEQQEQGSPPPQQEQGMELDQQRPAGGGAAPGGGEPAAGGGGGVSPARMSCADASQLLGGQAAAPTGGARHQQHLQQQQQQQQPELSQPAASGAGAGAVVQQAELPDPLVLATDEAGVYVAMSRLLTLVATTGRVPVEAVSAYRRSFMRLEPHGKRWFAYDSLKQMVDAAEWPGVHEWLLCK